MYHVCQSVHARGGIHTTTTLFLTCFKYSESSVQNSKKIPYKLCSKYAANLLPHRRRRVASNLARGSSRGGTLESPGKPPCTLPTEGAGSNSRALNVHLQAGLLPSKVSRYLMG